MAYKELFSTRVGALIDNLSELAMLRLHGERVADIALAAAEPGEAPVAGGGRPLAPRPRASSCGA
jgi:hypothetical protein